LRLVGAGLCVAASVLLLLCAFGLFTGRDAGWAGGVLFVVGLGLLLAAFKSLKSPGGGG
jgi:FtsH-binding integral membrane protein